MALNFVNKNQILYITLDNLKYGNSFGIEEANRLRDGLDTYSGHSLKGIIFGSSSRRFFCAGGNLSHYSKQQSREEGIADNQVIAKVLDQLSQWPGPTICVVQGDCLGGGMELLSTFDHVLATPHSYFGFWQRRIGLTWGWKGGGRWLSRIPMSTLRSLSLEARSFSAYEALRLGLIDGIEGEHSIYQAAEAWVMQQSSWPQEPIAAIKDFDSKSEQGRFQDLWWNPSHKKALQKFKDKN
ncbi:MAG: enoyl-CoA hydratase/isomerase family protein [Pseudobdellovibrionaceae bacterium]|nr:enoyl-CoA hydratase/isomerase family protein [Bdellovibrionales bacterium]USN46537.1 MAG: enoyl-CoA hydratase/isomerase family protein [Pseudobdellovibrionaceae bacterium]